MQTGVPVVTFLAEVDLAVAIRDIFTQYQATLDPLFAGTPFGLAEENLQSRIRGALLMALSLSWIGIPYLVMGAAHSYWMILVCATLVGITRKSARRFME